MKIGDKILVTSTDPDVDFKGEYGIVVRIFELQSTPVCTARMYQSLGEPEECFAIIDVTVVNEINNK